uniref:Putative nuclease HARBI1 n=1 Tax=Geotrypetes seraphini TaxID=260995 RepID=A0A6P8SIE1_GEOSA|nr:putative nuclease HARBI1 [Geotrypetes seraphini]
MEGVNVLVAVELLLQEEMENDRPHHRVHRRRLFRPHSSFLELTDQQCVERYRFNKATIQDLCLQLQPLLEARTRRNYPMPVHLKVTTALAFLATGSFQSVLASSTGLTQPAISNCLTQFLNAFLTHTRDYISLPTTPQALQDSMRQFYNVAQFPSVIRVGDCTYIALKPPRADEASYWNRKVFHSMNMQVVCNAQGEILDVCARYPGSTHDAYMVQHCGLHRRATQGHFNGAWLLVRKHQPLPDPPQQQLQQPPDANDDELPPVSQHRAEHSASQEGFNARHHLIQTHFL